MVVMDIEEMGCDAQMVRSLVIGGLSGRLHRGRMVAMLCVPASGMFLRLDGGRTRSTFLGAATKLLSDQPDESKKCYTGTQQVIPL